MIDRDESPSQELERNTITLGLTLLVVALLAVSSSAIFIRLSEGEISANATVFNRVALSTLVFGFWHGLNGASQTFFDDKPVQQKLDFSQDWWLFLAMAAFYITYQTLWAWSLTQTTVAISTVLISLRPLFTCLLAGLLWGERFDHKFSIGMIVAIAGTCAISMGDLQIASGQIQGDMAALLAAIFAAGYLMTVEKLRTKFPPTTVILGCCGLGTLLGLPILFFSEDRIFPYSMNGWMFVICLAIVCQVLGQGLLAYSLKKFSSGLIALVLILESILVAIAAWAIFGETLSFFKWIGFFVVLLGVYLAVSSKSAVKE